MYASEENVRYFQQLVRSFVPRHKAESQAPQSETLADDLAMEKTPGVSLLVSVAGGFGKLISRLRFRPSFRAAKAC